MEESSHGLTWHLPGGADKTMKTLNHDRWHHSQDSTWKLPKYQSEALPLKPTCLVEVIFLNDTITKKLTGMQTILLKILSGYPVHY